MAMMRGVMQGNWVRSSEHIVLRLVSLVFSVGSAYAVRWFFEPLDSGDPIHYVLWWIVAAGFGLLGFYLSRSLMHRMMAKEPIWAYVPVFVLVEFFEMLCNYAKAVSAVSAGSVSWVTHAPPSQQGMMTILTYVGWSILPLVSPSMAVADMDMTRRRNGEVAERQTPSGSRPVPLSPPRPAPKPATYPGVQPPTYGPVNRPAGVGAGTQGTQPPTHGAVNRPGWSPSRGDTTAQVPQRPALEPLPAKQESERTVPVAVPLAPTASR